MSTMNQDNFNELEDKVDDLITRLTAVERTAVSINQTSVLSRRAEDIRAEFDSRVEDLENFKQSMLGTVEAIKAWRTDIRNEIRFETATNTSGNTWSVTEAYDPNAPFLVFHGVVRVLPAQITSTSPEDGEFTTSISLTSPVTVLYFIDLELDE